MADPAFETNPFRTLPSVNALADHPVLAAHRDALPRSVIVAAARDELAACRAAIEHGALAGGPDPDVLARGVAGRLDRAARPPLAGAINATGIILHTGLGRAPLPRAAVAALADVAASYAPVELDLETGQRGSRANVVRGLLVELTGAESALVVNNNAAALVLALAAVARGRSVIVSRGELVEIGGSFRLPDVMEASGAHLREVGTTNKTRAADYERAVDETTAALLKVHTSNFRVEGFTESVAVEQLVELGRRHALPVIDDIGSGALVDLTELGLGGEPDARSAVRAGADLVLFSGDKVLGGPQAGIVVGRRHWIERLERHPLMRALRVDKLTLAALGATLQLHRDRTLAMHEVPVLRMATVALDELRGRGAALAERLRGSAGIAEAMVEEATAYFGGGALPAQGMPSVAVRVRADRLSEQELARRLRIGTPAVVARVQDGAVWLDMRTVLPEQREALAAAMLAAAGAGG